MVLPTCIRSHTAGSSVRDDVVSRHVAAGGTLSLPTKLGEPLADRPLAEVESVDEDELEDLLACLEEDKESDECKHGAQHVSAPFLPLSGRSTSSERVLS